MTKFSLLKLSVLIPIANKSNLVQSSTHVDIYMNIALSKDLEKIQWWYPMFECFKFFYNRILLGKVQSYLVWYIPWLYNYASTSFDRNNHHSHACLMKKIVSYTIFAKGNNLDNIKWQQAHKKSETYFDKYLFTLILTAYIALKMMTNIYNKG